MKVKDIEKKIGTLSNPSKMPSYAWGIPIEYCNTGSKLAEIDGTICKKCYAGKGCYVFPVVKAMYEKRYAHYLIQVRCPRMRGVYLQSIVM